MLSMKKMQSLQPEMTRIREQYKNNNELFKIAKDLDPTGFAGRVVNKGINEAKTFMTDIMLNVEDEAKAAQIELDRASKEFVQKRKALLDDTVIQQEQSAKIKYTKAIEDGEGLEIIVD